MDETRNDHTSAWLAYAFSEAFKAPVRRQLKLHFPDAVNLGSALHAAYTGCDQALIAKMGRNAPVIGQAMRTATVQARIKHAWHWQQSADNRHLLGLDHLAYPQALLAIDDAPPILYVRGRPAALAGPMIALVGARRASHNAMLLSYQIAGALAEAGIVVVSGLALGIDGAAHRGCMAKHGATVAVAATAANAKTYPASHHELAEQIVDNGAIVTEFALGNRLHRGCFPQRNRLISGLCVGVVIVEAARRSGSLITARHALEQGREVMTVPGSISNPLVRGCHSLIKQGAHLVESADDILHCLHLELTHHLGVDQDFPVTPPTLSCSAATQTLVTTDPEAQTLLDCLGFDTMPVDTLIARAGMSAARVTVALTSLELEGVIVVESDGRYSRCK